MRQRSGQHLRQGILWVMRLGILLMIAIALSALYHRYHLSPEQTELIRYVEVELPPLRRAEEPVGDRLAALLADRQSKAEVVRKQLVDELIPGFLRLRQMAEAPLRAAQTAPVQSLAREHLAVIDQYIDVCRTAVWVMDDAKLDPREALLRIGKALGAAAQRQRDFDAHLRATTKELKLAK